MLDEMMSGETLALSVINKINKKLNNFSILKTDF